MTTPEQIEFASKMLESERLIGKKTNAAYRWSFGLTALIFAFLSGVMKVDETFTFSWFNVSTSYNVIIICLSIGLALAQQNCFVLLHEGAIIGKRVKELYSEMNNSANNSVEEDDYLRILYPDTIGTGISIDFFGKTTFGVMYVLLLLLIANVALQIAPIVAQCYVMKYLFSEYPWNGWLIAMAVMLLLIQSAVVVSIVKLVLNDYLPMLEGEGKQKK